MMVRRAFFCAFVVLLSGTAAFAVDFGATVSNSTGYFPGSTTPFQQIDTLDLWFNTHLGTKLTFNSQLHGTVETIAPTAIVDLDSLNLVGLFPKIPKGPALFSFTLGRFGLSDVTGQIYNQIIDGLQLGFTYPTVSLTTTLGYTGLILSPDSTIVMTKADSLAQTVALTDPNSLRHFGSPRIVGLLNFKAPSLFLRQDLTLQAVFQQDLNPLFQTLIAPGTTTPSSSLGGALDSQYFTAAFSGPLVSMLFYNTSFTVETGRTLSFVTSTAGSIGSYQYEPILAYFASGGVRYYLTQLMSSVFGLSVLYASGDADYASLLEGNTLGKGTAFQPITQGTVATVFSPLLKNVAVGKLSYSLKPLSRSKDRSINNLETGLSVFSFLRPTVGPVGATGVNPATGEYYLGTEIDGTVNYRPFSDLGVSIQAGLFFPQASAFVTGYPALQWGGKIEVFFDF